MKIIYIILFLLVSPIVIFTLMLPNPKPMDRSNMFNRARMYWFAATRTYLYTPLLTYDAMKFFGRCRLFIEIIFNAGKYAKLFWWSENDELKNMRKII